MNSRTLLAVTLVAAVLQAPAEAQLGGPGRELVRTGRPELFATFANESPVLIGTLIDRVQAHNLERTWVLRGADAPAVAFPPHRSYGGEGGPYRQHIIPTVAGTAP